MSYILEALKKLEEKRRRETGPYFRSAEYPGRQDRKRNFPWGYLIAFALLLNAGMLLWWLHPWRLEKNPETGMENVVQKTRVRGPRDEGMDTVAGGPESRSPQLRPRTKTEDGPSTGYGAGYGDSVSTVLSQAPRPASDDTRSNAKTIGMSELPSSVRQKLPDLSISGHFYDSRPSSRVVTVGGKILHEGAAAAPGVTLERITLRGRSSPAKDTVFIKAFFNQKNSSMLCIGVGFLCHSRKRSASGILLRKDSRPRRVAEETGQAGMTNV